ncbi:hypothetical protein MOSE0_K08460 [Monosporozyma servazzii]
MLPIVCCYIETGKIVSLPSNVCETPTGQARQELEGAGRSLAGSGRRSPRIARQNAAPALGPQGEPEAKTGSNAPETRDCSVHAVRNLSKVSEIQKSTASSRIPSDGKFRLL